MENFSVLRFVIGLVFLSYASVCDVRTRRIPDFLWVILGALSIVFVEIDLLLGKAMLENHLILIPTAIIFFAVFYGKEMWTEDGFQLRPMRFGLYMLSLILLVYLIIHFLTVGGEGSSLFWAHLSMPVLLILAHVFYQFGVLRGGGDAKGFMCIALLVPISPKLDVGFPLVQLPEVAQSSMDTTFPFALIVLLDAALILLILPIGFLLLNATRRDIHGFEALLGYRASLDKLPKFTWLMDRIENGEHRRILFPRRQENREEEVRKLREKGYDRVWITPQIPFILLMTFGFLSAFIVGNFIVGLVLLLT